MLRGDFNAKVGDEELQVIDLNSLRDKRNGSHLWMINFAL